MDHYPVLHYAAVALSVRLNVDAGLLTVRKAVDAWLVWLSGVPGERRGSRDWREHGAGRLDEGRHRPLGHETATRYSVASGLIT